jgi:hypothetical protein
LIKIKLALWKKRNKRVTFDGFRKILSRSKQKETS